jgi:hypothetical protein
MKAVTHQSQCTSLNFGQIYYKRKFHAAAMSKGFLKEYGIQRDSWQFLIRHMERCVEDACSAAVPTITADPQYRANDGVIEDPFGDSSALHYSDQQRFRPVWSDSGRLAPNSNPRDVVASCPDSQRKIRERFVFELGRLIGLLEEAFHRPSASADTLIFVALFGRAYCQLPGTLLLPTELGEHHSGGYPWPDRSLDLRSRCAAIVDRILCRFEVLLEDAAEQHVEASRRDRWLLEHKCNVLHCALHEQCVRVDSSVLPFIEKRLNLVREEKPS